jgi:hypothetical protein
MSGRQHLGEKLSSARVEDELTNRFLYFDDSTDPMLLHRNKKYRKESGSIFCF